MNTPSNTEPEASVDSQGIARAALPETRPMYWSVRRELWENRVISIAPLLVGAVVLFGFAISTLGLAHRRRALLLLDPAQQRAAIERPYQIAALMILLTAFIIGVFYCLEALHGERRDRSILFWKSLPVSDLTTVLSKASIPLVVLPLISFAVIVTTHLIMVLLSTAVLLMSGLRAATLWPQLDFVPSPLTLLYALAVIALWHAPIYGWLLLVSGWARRTPFLWAVLPPFAIALFERIAFGSSHLASLLQYRFCGWLTRAFVPQPPGSVPTGTLAALDPGRFLTTPGLWIGLALAAVFLAAAVRLRRDREPI